MKTFKYYALLSLGVASFMGCSSDDGNLSKDSEWVVSGIATKMEGVVESDDSDELSEDTRSIFVGGTTGTRFIKLWDNADVAQVYENGKLVGTMTPDSPGDQHSTLSGVISGDFAPGDEVMLYLPQPDMDFTTQIGTLGSMSKDFDYMQATTEIESVNDGKVTTQSMTFQSRQAYFVFKFQDESGKLLHAKQFTIKAASGKLVATKKMDGTTIYTDNLVVNTQIDGTTSDYPVEVYVALLNESGVRDTYTFSILATDDKIYEGKAVLNYKITIGNMARATRAMICSTIDVKPSTSITPPESDDPDVEQIIL